jgi:hypothetical protein
MAGSQHAWCLLELMFAGTIAPTRAYNKPREFEGRHGKAKAHGLCTGHLDQWARGSPLSPIKQRREMCEFPDCGREHFANGLCRAHRQQQRQRLRRNLLKDDTAPNTWSFGQATSRGNISGRHADLVLVVHRAILRCP